MITPTAPALWAKLILSLNAHVPRWMSAIAPESEAAGSAEQASPSLPVCATSITRAVMGALICGPSSNSAATFLRLDGAPAALTRTDWYRMCELVEAPTVMAEGAEPGVWMDCSNG